MKKIIVVSVGCLALLMAGVIGLNLDKLVHAEDQACCPTEGERSYDVPPPKDLSPRLAPVAEYVPYMFLFQYLSSVDENHLTELRVKSKLESTEFEQLVRIARRFRTEVRGYDERARVIIDEFRRQYPPGRLPPGTGPGRPLPELIDLQEQRNNAALRYRDEAKSQVNNEKFDAFVNTEIHPKISRKEVK